MHMSWIEIAILVQFAGFIGGIGVMLKDYQTWDQDVTLGNILLCSTLTFFFWIIISHYIIQYTAIEVLKLIRLSGIEFKFENTVIIKRKQQ